MEAVVNGQTYSAGKLDAMKQFHVARRLGPAIWTLILTSVGSVQAVLPEGGATTVADTVASLGDAETLRGLTASIGPLVGILSTMGDADAEYVIHACLAAVSRRSGDGGAPIQTAEGHLLFSDIDMPVMLQLVFSVLRENLANFMHALPFQD